MAGEASAIVLTMALLESSGMSLGQAEEVNNLDNDFKGQPGMSLGQAEEVNNLDDDFKAQSGMSLRQAEEVK